MPEPTDPADGVAAHFCRRVRILRKERNWSLDQLAAASGVSRSMLSQIERGHANPTLSLSLKIARAFDLPLAELVAGEQDSGGIDLIRADDPAYHYRSDEQCSLRTLSPLHLEKDIEFYELRLQPGAALESAAHFPGTREFLSVTRGRVAVSAGESAAELRQGDSASYRADRPHRIANPGGREALCVLVVTYPGETG